MKKKPKLLTYFDIRINEVLNEFGFEYDYKEEASEREISFGYDCIEFSSECQKKRKNSVTFTLTIFNDKIEKVLKDMHWYYSCGIILIHDFNKLYKSIGKSELAHELNFEDYHFNKDNRVEVDIWINKFIVFMKEAGLPFFDSFKSINDVDTWYSEPVLNGTYNFGGEGLMWSSIIASALSDNGNYQTICRIWKGYFELWGEPMHIELLDRLMKYLDEKVIPLKSFILQN